MKKSANKYTNPLHFLFQSCLSFMDRGFVFRQIKKYVEKFKTCDAKALFDFKFTFLQIVCSHEHFVPFNLPLQANKLTKDCDEDPAKLKLSEDFLMRHFLAGLLLKQVSRLFFPKIHTSRISWTFVTKPLLRLHRVARKEACSV